MKFVFMAAPALVTLVLALPAVAAPAASPAAQAAGPATAGAASDDITFAQYRDYRIHYIEQRRARLAQELGESGLDAAEKAKLERQKQYYDWQAAMPAADRDRRFQNRFDEIDTNHDGKLEPAERAAWRTKERQYYRELAADRAAEHKP
jgi:hypothetical protein